MSRPMLLAVVLLSACGSAGGPGPAGTTQPRTVRIETEAGASEVLITPGPMRPHTSVVLVPLQEAWAALPGAYADLGLAGGTANEAARTFTVASLGAARGLKGVRLSRYLDCGATASTSNADLYAVTLHVSSRLEAVTAGTTQVETRLQATAKPLDTAGERVPCTSTGALEARIAELLRGPAR